MELLVNKITGPADIDWCEPNFTVIGSIAEPWNAASSVAFIVLGWIGYSAVLAHPFPKGVSAVQWRFEYLFLALLANGVGSVLHHATMLWLGQVLDELPSLWGTMLLLYCQVATTPKKSDNIKTMLTMHTMLATGAYLFWGFQYYAGAQGLSSFAVAALMLHCCLSSSHGLPLVQKKQLQHLAFAGLGALGAGFLFLWLPEWQYCAEYPDLFHAIRLHSIFHWTSAFGAYMMISAVQLFCYAKWQLNPTVKYSWGFIPMVVPNSEVKTK